MTLARHAVPDAGFGALNGMSLEGWLEGQGFESLTGLKA